MRKLLNARPAQVLLIAAVILNLAAAMYGVARASQPFTLVAVSLAGNLAILLLLYRHLLRGDLGSVVLPDQPDSDAEPVPASSLDEAPFRRLVDDFPEALILLADGEPYYVNRRFMSLLELSPEDMDEANFAFSRLLAYLRRLPERDNGADPVFRTVTGASRNIALEIRLHPLGPDGSPLTLVVLEDATARDDGDRQRQRMERDVIRQARLSALGRIAVGVAQAAGDPLTVILGVAEMGRLEHPDRPEFETILGSARKMAGLLDGLAERGRKDVADEEASVDLNRLIRGEIELFSSRISSAGVQAETELVGDLPTVRGVFSDFSLVVGTLLGHALASMQDSERRVLRVTTGHNDSAVLLEVSDTGSGLARKELSRLFEPLGTAVDDEQPGVGLPACRYLLSRYGATIEALSTPGMGTTFRVRIPEDAAPKSTVAAPPVEDASPAETHLMGVYLY